MLIDLSHVPDNESIHIHLVQACTDESIPSAGPIEIKAMVMKTGNDVCIKGSLSLMISCDCSRCLKRVSCMIQTPIEAHGELPPQHEKQEIDLWNDVRQAIILSLPEKPLCREDCPGLCPGCGKELVNGPCGCTNDQQQSSPMEKLKKYKF